MQPVNVDEATTAKLAEQLADKQIQKYQSSIDDLQGSDLVGLSKEWAEGRKPEVLCLDLFARLTQLAVALDAVCYFMQTDMDTVVALCRTDRDNVAKGGQSRVRGNDSVGNAGAGD